MSIVVSKQTCKALFVSPSAPFSSPKMKNCSVRCDMEMVLVKWAQGRKLPNLLTFPYVFISDKYQLTAQAH